MSFGSSLCVALRGIPRHVPLLVTSYQCWRSKRSLYEHRDWWQSMEGRLPCRILSLNLYVSYLEIWDSFKPPSSLYILLCRSTWYFIAVRAYLCFYALQNNKYNSYFMSVVLFLPGGHLSVRSYPAIWEPALRVCPRVLKCALFNMENTKQKPTQHRMIFSRCAIFRLAKPALFKYNENFISGSVFIHMFLPWFSDHRDQFFWLFELKKKLSWPYVWSRGWKRFFSDGDW